MNGKLNDPLFNIVHALLYRTVVSHQSKRGKKAFDLFLFLNQLKNLVLKKNKKNRSQVGAKADRRQVKKNIKKTHKVTILVTLATYIGLYE